MEATHVIAKNFIERSVVGLTMAVGIMWKDLFIEHFGKTSSNMFALIVTATIILACILAWVPEEFDPRRH